MWKKVKTCYWFDIQSHPLNLHCFVYDAAVQNYTLVAWGPLKLGGLGRAHRAHLIGEPWHRVNRAVLPVAILAPVGLIQRTAASFK